jgi:hypothetical protein
MWSYSMYEVIHPRAVSVGEPVTVQPVADTKSGTDYAKGVFP